MISVRSHNARTRGFTLVEVLSAIVVLAILGTITASLMMRTASMNADVSTTGQLHSELATAMERIDRALRAIPAQSGTTTPNITSVAASSITFGGNSSLTLTSSGSLQYVASGATAITLMSGVTAFSVQTYSDVNAALATSLSGTACNAIRRIAVTITASRAGVSDTLRNKVYLRCAASGAAPGA